MTNIVKIPPKPTRISKKVRDAINTRVRKGKSLAAAAEAAGMSRNGLAKALKRPAVQEYLLQVQTAFVAEVSASKAVYQALAYEVALDLMNNAQSESVRARMAEFLASDGKSGGVNVAVQINNPPAQGYEYPRPNQKVYEIKDTDCEVE